MYDCSMTDIVSQAKLASASYLEVVYIVYSDFEFFALHTVPADVFVEIWTFLMLKFATL